MNKEDYFKYYIQGSDYYLIPKYEFNELFDEMSNWREEAKELKKQLEERPKEYVFIGNAQNKTRDFINQITKDNKEYKNQQKKFIEYLEYQVKLQEELNDIHLATGFEEILSKYKEIIGD